MKVSIIRIGNSQGVRIPKALLEEAGLSGEVELRRDGQRIVIEPIQHPRAGWEEAAARLAAEGGDEPLMGDFANEWDEGEWAWPGEKA
jgi:antitoxin MazE